VADRSFAGRTTHRARRAGLVHPSRPRAIAMHRHRPHDLAPRHRQVCSRCAAATRLSRLPGGGDTHRHMGPARAMSHRLKAGIASSGRTQQGSNGPDGHGVRAGLSPRAFWCYHSAMTKPLDGQPLLTAEDARTSLFADLEISARTLQRRIRDAFEREDPDVIAAGGMLFAPETWWREALRRSPRDRRGRRATGSRVPPWPDAITGPVPGAPAAGGGGNPAPPPVRRVRRPRTPRDTLGRPPTVDDGT